MYPGTHFAKKQLVVPALCNTQGQKDKTKLKNTILTYQYPAMMLAGLNNQ